MMKGQVAENAAPAWLTGDEPPMNDAPPSNAFEGADWVKEQMAGNEPRGWGDHIERFGEDLGSVNWMTGQQDFSARDNRAMAEAQQQAELMGMLDQQFGRGSAHQGERCDGLSAW